jgi:putative SOS response-associated peptidase YedK
MGGSFANRLFLRLRRAKRPSTPFVPGLRRSLGRMEGPCERSVLQSYAIITTDANELMDPVHDRMPVILHPGDYDRWLDRDSDPGRRYLLRPFPADEMEAFEVSKDVGNVKNNSPELLNSK